MALKKAADPVKKLMIQEWTLMACTTTSMKQLVDAELLPVQAIGGWRFTAEKYPQPEDGELVVFEDWYLRGFGTPVHPFLIKPLKFYRLSLCHLHPNSILAVSIFITFCESFLGIPAHFNLWRYFYAMKKKGGSGGSQIAGGVYFVLRDNKKLEYLNLRAQTSIRDWFKKWFYIGTAEIDARVPCDVTKIPEQQESCKSPEI